MRSGRTRISYTVRLCRELTQDERLYSSDGDYVRIVRVRVAFLSTTYNLSYSRTRKIRRYRRKPRTRATSKVIVVVLWRVGR